ncbi:hypothetical protein LCGC14_0898050 [marine sediment metagenome]|uniref:Uncharacterized protein n=1 Tax=marine sediment metagenome TaxID=412755 RepID=A0A0F9RGB1_9ZZZZ
MPTKRKRARKRKPLSKAELDDYYLVKFTLPETHSHRGLRYGIVSHSSFDEDVKREAERGNLVISDCEVPISWIRAADHVEKVPVGCGLLPDIDLVEQWLDDKGKAAAQLALASPTCVNQLVSLDVADGLAWYIIVEETKRTLTVEWRSYGGGDRYTDVILGWGGTFPRDRLEPLIMSAEELNRFIAEIDRRKKQPAQQEATGV